MHPPCEMMVDSFLPAMREKVAKKLSEEGYSQGRIASLLGITQASVSLYLKSGDRSADHLRRLGISDEQASIYASLLAEDLKKNPLYAVNTLYSLWSNLLGGGSLCPAHRLEHPSLAQCEMCVTRFGPVSQSKEDAIGQVAAAVRLLEGSSVFVRLMPEVSVNIAYAPEGATSVGEVVAVPGRIVKVNGLPRSFMKPEYGASTHVASVLLLVLSRNPTKRAAMNTRYDARLEGILRRMRLRVLAVPGGPNLLEDLRLALSGSAGPLDALVDPGAQGSEPGLYLFSENPAAVVQLGLQMARTYVSTT